MPCIAEQTHKQARKSGEQGRSTRECFRSKVAVALQFSSIDFRIRRTCDREICQDRIFSYRAFAPACVSSPAICRPYLLSVTRVTKKEKEEVERKRSTQKRDPSSLSTHLTSPIHPFLSTHSSKPPPSPVPSTQHLANTPSQRKIEKEE